MVLDRVLQGLSDRVKCCKRNRTIPLLVCHPSDVGRFLKSLNVLFLLSAFSEAFTTKFPQQLLTSPKPAGAHNHLALTHNRSSFSWNLASRGFAAASQKVNVSLTTVEVSANLMSLKRVALMYMRFCLTLNMFINQTHTMNEVYPLSCS